MLQSQKRPQVNAPVAAKHPFPGIEPVILHYGAGLREPFHILAQSGGKGRVQVPQTREDLVAQHIAFVQALRVGAILAPAAAVLQHPLAYLFPGCAEQWANYAGPLAHTADSAQPRTPYQVEHQGLGIIIGVVRNGGGFIPVFGAQLCEPAVP